MTGNQTWKKQVKDYVAYKKHVQECFLASLSHEHRKGRFIQDWLIGKKPLHIPPDARVKMEVAINFHGERHGDPEGIFGAIADAIMDQDKHCAGSFDFSHDAQKEEGVMVTIKLYEQCRN